MATPILTTLRQSALDAVDRWPALEGRFRRKWYFEKTSMTLTPAELVPSLAELPAIAVYPAASPTPWVLNQAKEILYTLSIDLWTPHYDLLEAERLWQDVVEALFQCSNSAGVPYVKAASGYYPVADAFTPAPALLADGVNHAIKFSFPIGIRYHGFNPTTT